MKSPILEKIIPAMEKAITGASVLLSKAGEESDESKLIELLNEVNEQAIQKFDEATLNDFPRSYDFRQSYHDCIVVAVSYHPLSTFYSTHVDTEQSVTRQLRDYNILMKQGYKKLGLPNAVIESAVSKGEAAILQDLLKRSIRAQ